MAAQAGVVPVNPETKRKAPRNPGPWWGYWFLCTADRVLPEWVYRPLRAIGTAIAMAAMREERRNSRDYLGQVLGRPPRLPEVFRHFFAFEEALMLRLRITNGKEVPCHYAPGSEAFREWLENPSPVLLGTMHVGVSDMLGVQIASVQGRAIYIVRQQVKNSLDTEREEARFGSCLKFIWINDSREMILALKDAAQSPAAIALQCDRLEHSARTEAFEFLGERRLFPFTIYHLSLIFRRPVILSVGTLTRAGHSVLRCSPRFESIEGEPREAALARAHRHFQEFLRLVETILRENPYVWFNFLPLNPPVGPTVERQPSVPSR